MGKRKVARSGVYHVMSRGSGKQIIFEDNADRRHYIDVMRASFSADSGVTLIAWCLMDNHVHLLISGELADIAISMRLLSSSYAMYFNKRHARVGHLFQGRYKSVPIETDAQLAAVIRYIHQNPWKAGYSTSCDYPWSSYGEFLHCADDGAPATELLELFGGAEGFREFHAHLGGSQACTTEDAEFGSGHRAMPASVALDVARTTLGGIEPGAVSSLPRAKRDASISRLGAAGLSVRQIERLTGVSKSTVARLLGH